jgi:hypothetical protein
MKKAFFFTILINVIIMNGQTSNPSIGGGLGLGSFTGNFPSETILGGKLFLELNSPFTIFDKIQIHFSLAQNIEKFLPDSYSYDHYSYFTSIGVSGIFNQPLNESIFIEEGVGLIYLNDRSFSDIDSWNLGILISLASGIPISESIDLSLNIDYGLTLNNTNVSYFLLMLNGNYNF